MSTGIDQRRMTDFYVPRFGIDWVPPLSRKQLDRFPDRQLVEYVQARKQAEEWANRNRTGSGWVLPGWRRVMENWQKYKIIIILGGNRSSKTELASRLCMWAMGTIPEAEIRCYDVNQDYSKQRQQKYIYESLPESLKNLPTKRGPHHAISYRQGQGFTNDQLILPPLAGWTKGGQIDFVNYSQFSNDPKTAEGWRAHLVWCDEPLPVALFETLPYRLSDFRGRLIVTFTVLDGWTPLIADILGKVRTIEWRHSDLVGRKLPVWQESVTRADMGIFYFWTTDNPWANPEQFKLNLRGRSEDEVLARAHGIPTKAIKAAFPLFSRDVHVVKHENLPWVRREREALKAGKPVPKYPLTRYMAVDPAGARNWFMLWVAIDAAGTWWIYREWPDHATYGEWALPGPTPEGKEGPAQKTLGFGIKDYVALIRELEAGEEIFERIIDPRMGAAEKQSSDEGATTIISDMDQHDMTFVPAPGVDIDNGIQMLQGLISYKQDKERDSLNSPRLCISERCENLIYALQEYYDRCPPNAPIKDPVDAARYLAVSNIMYVAPEDLVAPPSGGSY